MFHARTQTRTHKQTQRMCHAGRMCHAEHVLDANQNHRTVASDVSGRTVWPNVLR